MELFEDKFLNHIVNTILIIFIMWLVYMVATGIVKRIFKVSAKIGDEKKSLTIMKLINNVLKYIIIVIAVLMILGQFGFDTKGLIASLGVAGAIAGLALKDIVSDFIVGISIVTDDQYKVGDYVTISGFTGVVTEVGMQTTKIQGLEGDVKIIPNGNIKEVINHSKNPNVIFIDIPTSYSAKTEKVEKVLLDVCEEINKNITYLASDLTLLGINNFGENAIIYRLSAEVEPMKGFEFKRAVLKTVKTHFDNNQLEIPYNQLVVHNE